jgi:ankyrin repeat protein
MAETNEPLALTPEERALIERDQLMLKLVGEFNAQNGSTWSDFYEQGTMQVSELEYWSALGRIAQVKLQLQQGADVHACSADKYTALHAAAENGHLEVVELLLKCQADPNARTTTGETPAIFASNNGYVAVVELLPQWHHDAVTTASLSTPPTRR